MTGKSDFTEEEWKLVVEAPPSAGLLVIAADRGGSIRETFSMAKTYTEVWKERGESELLDELVSARPEMDHTRCKSPEGLKQACLKHITDAVERRSRTTRQLSCPLRAVRRPSRTQSWSANDDRLIKRIDWILTNNPSITMKSSSLLNQFANGRWTSDHAGVLSVLKAPGGKKK